MGKMHEDEAEIDTKLARRLLCAQFPRWSDLPITRLASGGTVNAIFRVGRDLTVRLPLRSGGARAIAMEARLLPLLAPLLPLPIPEVVAIGARAMGIPMTGRCTGGSWATARSNAIWPSPSPSSLLVTSRSPSARSVGWPGPLDAF
jgi:aminoglycoside phosphotransferase (APT) family kinase protein